MFTSWLMELFYCLMSKCGERQFHDNHVEMLQTLTEDDKITSSPLKRLALKENKLVEQWNKKFYNLVFNSKLSYSGCTRFYDADVDKIRCIRYNNI